MKDFALKHSSTLFLKAVIVVVGILAFIALLVEPQFEGVNANATQFEIYFQDPFLAYIYLSFTPFFVALYQGLKLLGHIEKNRVFSHDSVKALRTIKYCGAIIAICIIGAMGFIAAMHGEDDAAGAIALGLFITTASIVISVAAALFEKLLQNAVEMKAEQDLTV